MPEPLLKAEGIVKVYPDGTVALRGVDFDIRPGEIQGLLGENGAGKTTLTKIISGLLPPTSGRILLGGEPVRLRSPKEALARGIGMVHQHFALVDDFTVLENIALGTGRPADRALRASVAELMERTGLRVPLDAPVENLAVGERQRVEILKVLSRAVRILILDEPTSVLTPVETDELFGFLRRLKGEGVGIVFITHKLREVLEITDRVTVLRRGEVVGEVLTRETSAEELARMMVGAELRPRGRRPVELLTDIPRERREAVRTGVEPVLVVEDLRVPAEGGGEAVKGISFELYPGEILGIAGVEGNGQTELVEAICGLRGGRGSARLRGREILGLPPLELYRLGLAHIPEDRWKYGLILSFTVAENSILGRQRSPRFLGPLTVLKWGEVFAHARELIARFSIQAPGLEAPAKSLSGGNQQKLIVGRELSKEPDVVIAAQPTRGLDIGAAEYIRDLLLGLRDEGKAILLVSADLDEVLELSDRVAFMYEGTFTAVTTPAELDRERAGLYMGGMRG
ncbi:TPA: ABC transporter ATP-binding protein [Candidatus Bipolaricaulota bacterium]|nr:ABC transporter ATP-binding protein [Candidatus Bipolaricaulota bacterium]